MGDADGRRRGRGGASRQNSIGANAGALAQRSVKPFVSEREKKDEANVKRKETRRQQKVLLGRLDELLPAEHRHQATRNCAGNRAVGVEGRSLHDVLKDLVRCIRAMDARQAVCSSMAARVKGFQHCPEALNIDDDTLKGGLSSSMSVAVWEVAMPCWNVLSLNPAGRFLFGRTPWGADSLGQSMLNGLVHCEDVATIENMWKEALAAGSHGRAEGKIRLLHGCSRPRSDQAPFFVQAGGGAKGGEGRELLTIEFVVVPLQIFAVRRGEGGEGRAILMATLASARVWSLGDGEGPALLLADPEVAGGRMRYLPPPVGLDRAAGESFLNAMEKMSAFSGIYQFDSSSCAARGVTPGKIRAAIHEATGAQDKELSRLRLAWRWILGVLSVTGHVGEWCVQSLLDTIMKYAQIHLSFQLDDYGLPFVRTHARLKFGLFETPWKYLTQISFNAEPMRLDTHQDRIWAVPVWLHAGRACMCLSEVWMAHAPHPLFPMPDHAHVGAAAEGGGAGAKRSDAQSRSPSPLGFGDVPHVGAHCVCVWVWVWVWVGGWVCECVGVCVHAHIHMSIHNVQVVW